MVQNNITLVVTFSTTTANSLTYTLRLKQAISVPQEERDGGAYSHLYASEMKNACGENIPL